MSNTEPPSRVPPRHQTHDSKAARDELTSKGKVEKVREVDPDEETRKKKFLKYYKDQPEDTEDVGKDRPTPFDLYAEGDSKPKGDKKKSDFQSSQGPQGSWEKGSLGGSLDPNASFESPEPPPSAPFNPPPPQEPSPDDDSDTEDGLPQSSDFWGDVDFPPDAPRSKEHFEEKQGGQQASSPMGKKEAFEEKIEEKVEENIAKKGDLDAKKAKVPHKKGDKKPTSQPFDPALKRKDASSLEEQELVSRKVQGKKEEHHKEHHRVRHAKKERKDKEVVQGEEAPFLPKAHPEAGSQKEGQKQKQQRPLEIDLQKLPPLAQNVQPIALQATQQAAPYLQPNTMHLFYQMVGTIQVMQNTQGVNRTEIVLNSPNYADSKFYGAKITIEKYASAPDSFNITLTGSNEAVSQFKESIPGLMSAFQNGNFSFKIGRLEAQYSIERPMFRRKDRGEGRGDTGGGNLKDGR